MTASSKAHAAYRQFIPDDNYERFSKEVLAKVNIYEWLDYRLASGPFVGNWLEQWRERLDEPFKGITTDGSVREGLYKLAEIPAEPSETIRAMVTAAKNLLAIASPEQSKLLQHDVQAKEWRAWSNPELYVFRHGLRLEECPDDIVDAVHAILKASLSPPGYKKVLGCMKVNKFLGDVVDGPQVLNARSYNFSLFGEPAPTKPWGWQLTGHHLCVNCFTLASQQIISPVFMGAEPNIIDEGPEAGLSLFEAQEAAGLELMLGLDPSLQEEVQIYDSVGPEGKPQWRQ